MAKFKIPVGDISLDLNNWPTLMVGEDAAGDPVPLLVTSDGSMTVEAGPLNTSSANSPSRFQNLGANATLNVKASAGNVFSLTCYNANASPRYLQLHNTATVPTTAVTAPTFCFLVPTLSQIIVGTDFFTNNGVNFATGIAFAFSTTRDVYTAGSAGDQTTVILFA